MTFKSAYCNNCRHGLRIQIFMILQQIPISSCLPIHEFEVLLIVTAAQFRTIFLENKSIESAVGFQHLVLK